MTGEEAQRAWDQAFALATEGKYDEARKVVMLKSDYRALEEMILKLEESKRILAERTANAKGVK